MESQPSPTCRILQIQEWPIFAEFELYVHLARHISSLVFYSPFFFLMYLLIIMGFFYGSLSHRQKCCILPMNEKKTGEEINPTMTTIRLWGIYHVHGLISLTRPGNDNWTRTPFKRILHYTIYNSYSSNGWKIVKIVAILNEQYTHSNFWRCKKGYRSVIFLLNSLCKVVQTHQWVFHAWFCFALWRYNCWRIIYKERKGNLYSDM